MLCPSCTITRTTPAAASSAARPGCTRVSRLSFQGWPLAIHGADYSSRLLGGGGGGSGLRTDDRQHRAQPALESQTQWLGCLLPSLPCCAAAAGPAAARGLRSSAVGGRRCARHCRVRSMRCVSIDSRRQSAGGPLSQLHPEQLRKHPPLHRQPAAGPASAQGEGRAVRTCRPCRPLPAPACSPFLPTTAAESDDKCAPALSRASPQVTAVAAPEQGIRPPAANGSSPLHDVVIVGAVRTPMCKAKVGRTLCFPPAAGSAAAHGFAPQPGPPSHPPCRTTPPFLCYLPALCSPPTPLPPCPLPPPAAGGLPQAGPGG